jgi:ABC-type amino acid transport substrate-binding protein
VAVTDEAILKIKAMIRSGELRLPKGQGQYAEVVRGAVQALMDNGTYAKILEKWNVADGAIPTAEIRS